MNKLVIPALAAVSVLSLSACGDTTPADATAEADTAMTSEAPANSMVEPVGDSDPDSVTISEDGVTADIDDGHTSVSADIGKNPSVSVTAE